MKKGQYNTLKAKLEMELQEAEAAVARAKRKLDALNVVWEEILGPTDTVSMQPEVIDANGEERPRAQVSSDADLLNAIISLQQSDAVTSRIDKIVAEMRHDFGVQEVVEEYKKRYQGEEPNRTTVSGRLRQLSEHRKLTLVVRGTGRLASVFRPTAMSAAGTDANGHLLGGTV